MTDTLIVGGGLAGACAALWLSRHGSVTVLEAERPAAGASGAAAGLVNPFMGRKAKPGWRFEEALDALHATLDRAEAGSLFRPGLLRPARDAAQAEVFRQRADALPDHAGWRSADALRERYPDLDAPHGGLWLPAGGALDLSAVVEALLGAVAANGATVRTGVRVTGWDEFDDRVVVVTDAGEDLEARRAVLALGDGFRRFDELAALPLHRIKGQTIRLAPPGGLRDLPPLSGFGYVVPEPAPANRQAGEAHAGGEALIVGSTYEHDFEDVEPTAAQSEALVAKAARMVPALAGARVLEARAGIRVTVPRTHSPWRLPLVGPLIKRQRVWAFTGLGSKGLMTAPLLARRMAAWLEEPSLVPSEVRLR